ncbi:hypothetical protein KHQ81_05730 [Mycoplasmatota bacterium]|nr:hypothetical protein KHQ81_05730 [Mycoplasmatota bacterium]
MKKDVIVKKSGFSCLEMIYCLFIFINLFVLCCQIIYNINTNLKVEEKKRVLTYETVALRIENHLKEVSDYEIGEDYFYYYYRNHLYYYAVINNYLILKIDSVRYNIIEHVMKISFHYNQYFLKITITDIYHNTYYIEVILYDK